MMDDFNRNDTRLQSLTQSVYEQLRYELMACRLPPGKKLRIKELALSLSVSIGVVREALSRLTSEGLVVAEPQRGFLAAPISLEDLIDLTAVWVDSEVACLRRSIRCGDVAWEAQLVAAHHHLSRTPEREAENPGQVSEAWVRAHTEYHRALVAGADSPWLLRLREMLYALTERYRRLSAPLATAKRSVSDEHNAILKAALARDADTAVELLTEHVRITTAVLLEGTSLDATAAIGSGGSVRTHVAGKARLSVV